MSLAVLAIGVSCIHESVKNDGSVIQADLLVLVTIDLLSWIPHGLMELLLEQLNISVSV